jgi:hypothetical protein
MLKELTLLKKQNNRPGNKWHIIRPVEAFGAYVPPAVCLDAAQLQAARVNDHHWGSAQRELPVLWDSTQPAFFTVKGEADRRIHARDICQQCSLALLKDHYAEEKEGAHNVSGQ